MREWLTIWGHTVMYREGHLCLRGSGKMDVPLIRVTT